MKPTKFPKYWVVDIQENADHKLLPKFKKWLNNVSKNYWSLDCRLYGRFNDDYIGYVDELHLERRLVEIVNLEEWNDHFFPNKQERKEVPFKKIKNTPQYKTQKALAEHYKSLANSGVGELYFSNVQNANLIDALNKITNITTDQLAKKVAQMAKDTHENDKLIHARKLFGNK